VTTIVPFRPDSDELDTLTSGYVRAERINDILSFENTKRHQQYLRFVMDQLAGEPVTDPADAYRDRPLLPRAIDAYQQKHGVELVTNRIYCHDDFAICCVPDAVDELIGLTIHIRKTEDTYKAAAQKGLTPDMNRHAQAMIQITGLDYWIHLNYFEDAETRKRRMLEIAVIREKYLGQRLEEQMIEFLSRTRHAAVA